MANIMQWTLRRSLVSGCSWPVGFAGGSIRLQPMPQGSRSDVGFHIRSNENQDCRCSQLKDWAAAETEFAADAATKNQADNFNAAMGKNHGQAWQHAQAAGVGNESNGYLD